MSKEQTATKGLKKVLGFARLFIITIGIVVSQSSVVSLLQGAGLGGPTFILAIFIAFLISLCYISTYSELALMMPRAGTVSTYTAVSLGHFPAIIASLAAYFAPALLGAIAELFLLQNVVDTIFPGSFTYLSLILIWTFALLNILGIDLFASVQSAISLTMLVTLVSMGIIGLGSGNAAGIPADQILQRLAHPNNSLFTLVLVALWPFIAFELICDFIEEAEKPAKDIPRTMFTACVTLLIIYCLVAFAAMKVVPVEKLSTTDIPHLLFGELVFGKWGQVIILVLSITTTSGFISTGFATTPRLLYGMAHHKQLPALFMNLHPKWRTPWFGVLFMASLITIAVLIFKNNADALLMVVISGASCYLLAYIFAHIDLMVLRKKYRHYPRQFRSPLFPLLQLFGIAAMIYAFVNNSPTADLRMKVYLNVGVFIFLTGLYAFFWVKIKMKKGFFEPEPIEQALKD